MQQRTTGRRGGGGRGRQNFSRQKNSRHGGGNRRSFHSGHGRGKQKRGLGERIDPARFIHKAVRIEEKPYVAKHAFVDFPVDDRIKRNIIAKGFTTPSPIQDEAISYILEGKDLLGLANTGTGKTAAFLIPLIEKVLKNKKEEILIVAPTRELAIQIDEELKEFTRGMGIYSACIVGGAPAGKQIHALRRQNNFIIGTPGRLRDMIERKYLSLATFGTVVLDEADRMLDMGFIGDIRSMLGAMPEKHHTLFFSATITREIERLIGEFLKEPVRVSVKTGNTAKSVDQDVVRLRGSDKVDTLYDLLQSPDFEKVLVFGRTKHGVENLSRTLGKRGVRAESIHGNKSHPQRQRSLKHFKEDSAKVLVATDVAARGLDIPNVSHVINYDVPATYEDYVHRIGRTGRAGKTGKALTFIG